MCSKADSDVVFDRQYYNAIKLNIASQHFLFSSMHMLPKKSSVGSWKSILWGHIALFVKMRFNGNGDTQYC